MTIFAAAHTREFFTRCRLPDEIAGKIIGIVVASPGSSVRLRSNPALWQCPEAYFMVLWLGGLGGVVGVLGEGGVAGAGCVPGVGGVPGSGAGGLVGEGGVLGAGAGVVPGVGAGAGGVDCAKISPALNTEVSASTFSNFIFFKLL